MPVNSEVFIILLECVSLFLMQKIWKISIIYNTVTLQTYYKNGQNVCNTKN